MKTHQEMHSLKEYWTTMHQDDEHREDSCVCFYSIMRFPWHSLLFKAVSTFFSYFSVTANGIAFLLSKWQTIHDDGLILISHDANCYFCQIEASWHGWTSLTRRNRSHSDGRWGVLLCCVVLCCVVLCCVIRSVEWVFAHCFSSFWIFYHHFLVFFWLLRASGWCIGVVT